MLNIMKINLNKNLKDMYLLFWSILMPLAAILGIKIFEIAVKPPLLFGIILLSMFFYCCTTNSFAIYSQRKRGVFDLLGTTPFPMAKYLIAAAMTQMLIALSVALPLLVIENHLFALQLQFSQIILFLPLLFLAALAFTLLGFAVSVLPKNEGQLSITNNLLLLPLIICSQIFINLATAPKILSYVAFLNPFQWLVEGFMAILNRNLPTFLLTLIVMSFFTGLALLLAVKSFRTTD